MTMSKKIIIYNLVYYAGGTLVMSALCKTLRELGYDARILFTQYYQCNQDDKHGHIIYVWKMLVKQYLSYILHRIFPNTKLGAKSLPPNSPLTTMPGIKIQYNPFFNRHNTIVVYPESLYGNPLFAKNVVRWLLYFYRFKDVEGAFGKDDLFICYRDIFNDLNLNPEGYKLNISYFDSNLYRQYNFGLRKGNCYILRKGKTRKDLPAHFDGPVFDNNMSEEELVKMFNEYKYVYSYDTQTFYTTVAMVCGCIPIIVMESGKTIEDYLDENERVHYGEAYGDIPEQIEYAIKTREKRLAMLDYSESNSNNVKNVISLLEKKFGKIKRLM